MSGHHPWKDIKRKSQYNTQNPTNIKYGEINKLRDAHIDIDKQHHVHDTKCSKVCRQGKTKGIIPWDHQLKKVAGLMKHELQIIDLWGIDYQ